MNDLKKTYVKNKTIICNYIGKRGGGPQYAYGMVKGLIDNGINVVAIIPDNIENLGQWELLSNCCIFKVKGYTDNYFSFIKSFIWLEVFGKKRIKNMFMNRDIQFIYIPMGSPLQEVINSCFKGNLIVSTLHDPIPHKGDEHSIFAWISNLHLKKADRIVVLSESFREFVMKKYSKSSKDVKVIPHGIFDGYKILYNNKYKQMYDSKNFNFLFFGRIEEYKGLDILGEVYKRLINKYSNISLTVVGRGNFLPYQDIYNNLKNFTLINRWINDEEVYGFFKGPNIITVLPYTNATQSGVIPLAMASNSFVICSDCGGLPEQIEDGVTGKLVKSGNIESLYLAMEDVIKNGINYNIINNARLYIEGLSWDKLAIQLLDFIS